MSGPAGANPADGGPAAEQAVRQRPRWRGPLLLIGKIALVVIGAYLVIEAVRAVDWRSVGDGLSRLNLIEIVVIVVIVGVRQMVNASTLPVLIPKLSLPHAFSTAFSGTLIQTFTPPPADAVLRLSMLRSYGVETTRGAAALVLDTVVFYLARFVAPVIGIVLAVIVQPVESVQLWMAVGGAVAGVVLLWAMVTISRGENAAASVGRTAARIVRRLRPTVDPEAWAAAVIRFQKESATGLTRRLGRATPIMLVYILVDSLVVLASLRFVGIPGAHIGYFAVMAAMFSLYPLTIFPFAGLGVLDAAMIVLINAEGVVDSADLVAAMVIWRAATLILPLVPGLITLTQWRAREARRAKAAGTGD